MNSKQITSKILELCSEDAYGSWELWWGVSKDASEKDKQFLKKLFTESIVKLIKLKKITALNHKNSGKFIKVPFETIRLEFELKNSNKPDPNSYYWFEERNKKR